MLIIPVANSCCLVRALQVPSTKRSYYHYLFKSRKQFHVVNAPVMPIFWMRKLPQRSNLLKVSQLVNGRVEFRSR